MKAASPTPKSPPTRRISRFTLRTAGLLIVLLSVALGGITAWRDDAHDQQRAVEAISVAGGWVEYDHQRDQRAQPSGPQWLRDYLGKDFFDSVVGASIPTNFQSAAALTRLQFLELVGAEFTEETLAPVAGLTQLRRLHLRGTRVTKAGLAVIADLPEIESLDFGSTQVDAAGLAHLKTMANLSHLNLAYTQTGDAGLRHVGALQQLETLNLQGCDLNDQGLQQIAKLKNLRALNLAQCEVTSAGLRHLQALHRLADLNLANTDARDEVLSSLAGLSALKNLSLAGTMVVDVAGSLPRLETLEELNLAGLEIDERALEHFNTIDTLRVLQVGNLSITDAHLPALTRLVLRENLQLEGGLLLRPRTLHWVQLEQLSSLVNRGGRDLEQIRSVDELAETIERANSPAF